MLSSHCDVPIIAAKAKNNTQPEKTRKTYSSAVVLREATSGFEMTAKPLFTLNGAASLRKGQILWTRLYSESTSLSNLPAMV
ncbi:hypothetical protein GJ496_010241 [Pomphorhynchus laevis]|nr:hypothetical protein GJ496_010241 [Pomphorhynchus laevis]